MTSFKLHGSAGNLEGLSLRAIAGHHRPHHKVEVMTGQPPRFFIYNTVTKEATSSAPTIELIERVYNWHDDKWFAKRGPEQVIVELSPALGITLHNFHTLPMPVIWDGVATYAKTKGSTE